MLPTVWGKLQRDEATGEVKRCLDLISHCLDVAAVTRALLELPVIRSRMEGLAGRKLSDGDIDRLTVLAFLHDLGKASRGFQGKWFNGEVRRSWMGRIRFDECGHTHVVTALFPEGDDALHARFLEVFPLEDIWRWHGESGFALLFASISHHGTPIRDSDYGRAMRETWLANEHYDPFSTLKELGDTAMALWPGAFEHDGEALPDSAAFTHAFAGLVSLADWIGSEDEQRAFHYELAPADRRWPVALETARRVLREKRIDLRSLQQWLAEHRPAFGDVFKDADGNAFHPSPLQQRMADPALGPLVVVEAETGSGKTEAALWRFKTLFEAGEVDSLAFVLPTRVSAVQIEQRIDAFMKALFPGDMPRPNVVLAVPGYLQVDGVHAIERLPGWQVHWPDSQDEQLAHRRWAAENSKRYLAASCAVGTIDQVLLSGLKARHAHLRGFALLRSLLVVDEVHASDRYMVSVLNAVLQRHINAGGHALLLSATLGVAARDELLALGGRVSQRSAEEREAAPYPALTDRNGSQWMPSDKADKCVSITLQRWMRDAAGIAACAADAVQSGARVLVVRNTVNGVIEVQRELEALLGEDHPALFRCEGVVCPHHGRYAADDRRLLDEAVNEAFGKGSPSGARVLVGSQTLEQSLDIDADLLITDIAPMDILLQRLGRLHRHASRSRPNGFAQPRAIVLTPSERDLGPVLRSARGNHGLGSVYRNVLSVEATWRELEAATELRIPRDNRKLVEHCTDPGALAALAEQLGGEWPRHWQQVDGKERAQAGEAWMQALDWDVEWSDVTFPHAGEERVRTRLGTDALRVQFSEPVTSPFGQVLKEIAVPGWMVGGGGDLPGQLVVLPSSCSDGFDFALTALTLKYGRFGITTRSKEFDKCVARG